MKMGGYGGLERSLRDERGLWVVNEEEGKKFLCYRQQDIRHGRANLLEFCIGFGLNIWHGRASLSTGRANLLVLGASKFFTFLESYLDNYLQNNLKQRKTNKTKAIKCVGCLPRSARLMSLA